MEFNKDRFAIKIGIFGAVSVGKTTFLNALFAEILSESKRKKCTLLPQVYQEVDMTNKNKVKEIREKNKLENAKILKMLEDKPEEFTIDICRPIFYDIEPIYRFFSTKLHTFYLDIYDLPGLDDGCISNSKDVFFKWIDLNFYLFDIIIFITDIDKALNQNGEIEILKLIFENIKKRNDKSIFFIPLINKCDNLDENGNLTNFENDIEDNGEIIDIDEDMEMYEQANNVLSKMIKEYGLEIKTKFIPLSAENAFIFRLLAKHPDEILNKTLLNILGKNEYGHRWHSMNKDKKNKALKDIIDSLKKVKSYDEKMKQTGFIHFKNKMEDIIIKNKYSFLRNQTINECTNIPNINNFNEFIEYANKLIEKSKLMLEKFNASNDDILFKKFDEYLVTYYNNIYKDDRINKINHPYNIFFEIYYNLMNLDNELKMFTDLIIKHYDKVILMEYFADHLKRCTENKNNISELSEKVLLKYEINFNTFHIYDNIVMFFNNIINGTSKSFNIVAKEFISRLRYSSNFTKFMDYNDNIKIISCIRQNYNTNDILIDLILDKLKLLNDTFQHCDSIKQKNNYIYLICLKYYLKQKYSNTTDNKIIQINEAIKYVLPNYTTYELIFKDGEINYLSANIDFEKSILN